MAKYKVVDLFCGAGGLSLGFEREGAFKVVAAVELNQNARKTYLQNHSDQSIRNHFPENVRDVDFKILNEAVGEVDVVIGGPPCQGFSNANRQKNHTVSMNNQLVKDYFRAIRDIKPKAFVMENVGMLKSSTHRFFDSSTDHDEMLRLNIPMTTSGLFVSSQYERFNILEQIVETPELMSQYQLEPALYQLLNVYAKKTSESAQHHFLNTYHATLVKKINLDKSYDHQMLADLIPGIENLLLDDLQQDHLKYIIAFQKSLKTINELMDNRIIFDLTRNNKDLEAQVNSYSVLDYIKLIMDNSYSTFHHVYEATNFGVPQHRRRFLMIGLRRDLLNEQQTEIDGTPIINHRVDHIPDVRQAIEDLKDVPVSTEVSDGPVIQDDTIVRSAYAESLRDRGSNLIYNHIVPKTRETAMARFKKIKPGQNFHSLPSELKSTYAVPERTQNTIYLRVNYDQPSGTVVNVRKSMWIHPEKNRAISVREAARIQSFPDEYHFAGPKDSQYQQVGNAVPPLMAQGVAEFIASLLDGRTAPNHE